MAKFLRGALRTVSSRARHRRLSGWSRLNAAQTQAGLCWTLMGGYEHGDLLSHISELGFETQEAMLEMSYKWILDHWRSG